MAIEGPLKELHIHDVFQLLDLGRKTGVLRVTSELRQNAGTVYFEQGAVVGAEIRSNPFPLGGLLVRSGKVSEEDVAHARAVQPTRSGMRLGEILLEIGALSRRELDRMVRIQVEEVIFELMSWSEGYFSFEEGAAGRTIAEATYRIPTESLLMEAARRIDEWSWMEARIPHLGVVARLAPGPAEDGGMIDLRPAEWEVLAAVDGDSDVRDIARRVGRSDFEVAKTLFGLDAGGVIVIGGREPTADAGHNDLLVLVAEAENCLAAGDLVQARAVAEEAVLGHAHEATAHQVLGRVLFAEGRFEEASLRLGHAVELEPDALLALRLLGLAQAAVGRFEEAIQAWDRWCALEHRGGEEQIRLGEVVRLREAAGTLGRALGRIR